MNVLLLSLGNAPGRYQPVSTHCENYVSHDLGGHEIITFGYNNGVDIQIAPQDDFDKVIRNLPEGWVPDLCVLWLIEWNLLPSGIEKAPFPTVACVFDWDYDVPYSKAWAESVDLTIVTGQDDRQAMLSIGANDVMSYFFSGALKDYISEEPKKIRDRKYDILYTTWIENTVQPERTAWIFRLYSISGKYAVRVDRHMAYSDYVDLLRDSKLVLSYNRHGAMAVRVVDAGAQGTVVLEPGSGTQSYFEPDKEYIPVTQDNFLARIDRYLSDPDRLQEISDRFHARVTSEFTAEKRFLGLLELAFERTRGKPLRRKTNLLTDAEKHSRRGEICYYAYFVGSPGQYLQGVGSRLLELSMQEFKESASLVPSARTMTNLAVSSASFNFIFNKDCFSNEKIEPLIVILQDAIALDPMYVMAYFNMAIIYMRASDTENALKSFSDCLILLDKPDAFIDPWCLSIRYHDLYNDMLRRNINKYLVMLSEGQNTEVLHELSDLLRSACHYMVALLYTDTGHIFETMQSALQAYNLHKNYLPIAKFTSQVSATLGHHDLAISLFMEYISLFPLDVDMKLSLADLLYFNNMDRDALNVLRDVVNLTKAVPQLHEYVDKVKNIFNRLTRFKSPYSGGYDPVNEVLLNKWIQNLYAYLLKNPYDVRIVSRMIDIWNRLGRHDCSIKLLNSYVNYYVSDKHLDMGSINKLVSVFESIRNGFKGKQDKLDIDLKRIEHRFKSTV